MVKKVRIHHLHQMKAAGRPIAMITAYDAVMAGIADEGSADVILVGDSVGTTVHGFDTTLPVTLEMMIMHTQAVVRGSRRSLIVTDLPFMSYQVSEQQAIENAGRLMKEGGSSAVKLETSNDRTLPFIRAIVDSGIPVMGHIGLVPQSINQLGGYRVQGRDQADAGRLIELAHKVQEAGAFAIVLELIPSELAARITSELTIPTIGIGAGPETDGQVLVVNDVLGLTENAPRFSRKYVDLRAGVLRAVRKYTRDVREGHFPAEEHEFH
ncbi:MAG: 3-methyl-2-oxobutanoate hydroxymethyltransferase [Candidatus Sumerlaeia bacterium]|nr:3-methyl-2-oxobutanoate hydroxymethyltransferase [Candidatus Sumerlaeia bacterium]